MRLWWAGRSSTDQLVDQSYNRIASGYDATWTQHMRHLSMKLVDAMTIQPGERCCDLTCGTGFVTRALAQRSGQAAIGVDRSAGMLEAARQGAEAQCQYERADVIDWLDGQAEQSFDAITCAWGLGYSRPIRLISRARRLLRPGGRLGIIDNTSFSLFEVMVTALQAFAEQPGALQNVMAVRFLPHSCIIGAMMRLSGLSVTRRADGAHHYYVADGRAAIDRLIATGAAAGFEHATQPTCREALFARFAELADQRLRDSQGVRVTHRYLLAVGTRR
jgi:ubiquinone/menaquinone biosynthesis C-methylase UbiE